MTSIRKRLLTALVPGLVVVLIVGGIAVYLLVRADLFDQLDEQVQQRHRALVTTASFEEGLLEIDEDEVADVAGAAFFEFLLDDGEVLYRSDTLRNQPLEFGAPEEVIETVALPSGGAARAMRTTFRLEPDDEDGEIDTTGMPASEPIQLTVALDLAPVQQALTTLIAALTLVGAVVLAAVVALLLTGVRWGLSPLDRLRTQIAAVDDDTSDTQFDDHGAPRELLPVYRELNSLIDRMDHTLQRERAFADAAAHELRTPLAELRSIAEVAVTWTDPQRTDKALHELLAIGTEMQSLIELLLKMSRGNVNGTPDDVADVLVQPIVARSMDFTSQQIADKRLSASVVLDETTSLHGSRAVIETILRNLIENAVQYTPESGRITIESEPDSNGSAALIIRNGPVDLTCDDVNHLFDPFWRKDKARGDRTHVGLGLSVAQRLADAGGLKVRADLDHGDLRMRVSSSAGH